MDMEMDILDILDIFLLFAESTNNEHWTVNSLLNITYMMKICFFAFCIPNQYQQRHQYCISCSNAKIKVVFVIELYFFLFWLCLWNVKSCSSQQWADYAFAQHDVVQFTQFELVPSLLNWLLLCVCVWNFPFTQLCNERNETIEYT